MAISDQLTTISDIKDDIRNAIIYKGVPVSGSTSFSGYTQKIMDLNGYVDDKYVRPSEWLTLPTVNTGDTKFVGLYAIYDSDNRVGLICGRNYTVDWGDGIIENFNWGSTATHNFVYSGSTFTGQTVTSFGYKQSIITITPQSGQPWTWVKLYVCPSGSTTGSTSGWLDIKMAGSGVTLLTIGGGGINNGLIRHMKLEQFEYVGTHGVTSFSQLFEWCVSFKNLVTPIFSDNVTNFSEMFCRCTSLINAPFFNTVSGTNMSIMFYQAYKLVYVPLYDSRRVTNFSYMFQSCYSLKNPPAFNTIKATSVLQMYYGCHSIKTVQPFNFGGACDMSQAYGACVSLKKVPLMQVSGVTSFGGTGGTTLSTFNLCYALIESNLSGGTKSISYANCCLSTKELINIFINLGTGTGQGIDITGNYGAAGLSAPNRAIATGKGWTIIG